MIDQETFVKKWCMFAGFVTDEMVADLAALLAAERERCAKIALAQEQPYGLRCIYSKHDWRVALEAIAAAIRRKI